MLKTFETAEEGLQALERERFDIIISDFQLPGINGVEFFKRVMVTHPDTIKILISGYGNECTISEAFEIGVDAFIKKPFSLTAFIEKLLPHVEKRHDRKSQSNDTASTETEPENQNLGPSHRQQYQWLTDFKCNACYKSFILPPSQFEKKNGIQG